MKTALKNRIDKRFGSRKAFIVYAVCLFVTVATLAVSIVSFFVFARHPVEKLAEHILLCALAMFLLNIPPFLRARFRFQTPSFLQIIIAVFIMAHCVLGEIYLFYTRIPFYDKFLHISAGMVIAILGFSVVYGFAKNESGHVKLSPFFLALFSFCFALALLTLWEVLEYGMDAMFGMNMQRWQNGLTEVEIDGATQWVTDPAKGSGLVDTMEDLIIGIIGAAVFSVLGALWVKKHPGSTKFYVTRAHADGQSLSLKD
ncbi:MAG: hypothetical protein FWD58_06000 [Firmicutes bacterium]|nr:hypothetical protein [Bacillota bacterium]